MEKIITLNDYWDCKIQLEKQVIKEFMKKAYEFL